MFNIKLKQIEENLITMKNQKYQSSDMGTYASNLTNPPKKISAQGIRNILRKNLNIVWIFLLYCSKK